MIRSLDAFVSGLLRAEPQTIFAAAVAVGSLLIYRRFKDAPTLLLLVGAIAQFVIFAGGTLSYYAVTRDWIVLGSFLFNCWLLVHAVAVILAICFPVGLAWHALRTIRNI